MATHMNDDQKEKNQGENDLPLIIANTALDIENDSPAACNRDFAIPFPVPVSQVTCEESVQLINIDQAVKWQ